MVLRLAGLKPSGFWNASFSAAAFRASPVRAASASPMPVWFASRHKPFSTGCWQHRVRVYWPMCNVWNSRGCHVSQASNTRRPASTCNDGSYALDLGIKATFDVYLGVDMFLEPEWDASKTVGRDLCLALRMFGTCLQVWRVGMKQTTTASPFE